MLKSVAVDRLPDRGQRLQGKLDELESALANLNLEIEEGKRMPFVILQALSCSNSRLAILMCVLYYAEFGRWNLVS